MRCKLCLEIGVDEQPTDSHYDEPVLVTGPIDGDHADQMVVGNHPRAGHPRTRRATLLRRRPRGGHVQVQRGPAAATPAGPAARTRARCPASGPAGPTPTETRPPRTAAIVSARLGSLPSPSATPTHPSTRRRSITARNPAAAGIAAGLQLPAPAATRPATPYPRRPDRPSPQASGPTVAHRPPTPSGHGRQTMRPDNGLLSGTSDNDDQRAPGNGRAAAVSDSGTLSGTSVGEERKPDASPWRRSNCGQAPTIPDGQLHSGKVNMCHCRRQATW
jgi:hypothetical protein